MANTRSGGAATTTLRETARNPGGAALMRAE
jgi:hypothetical protein